MLVYHVNTQGNICTTFDISPTCQAIVFGDSGGEYNKQFVNINLVCREVIYGSTAVGFCLTLPVLVSF